MPPLGCGKHSLLRLFGYRDDDLYHRSRIRVRQSQFSAKFFDPLSHSTNSDTDGSGPKFYDSVLQPFTVVPNLDGNAFRVSSQNNPTASRFRVSKDIRERFLHDPENGSLELRRKSRKGRGPNLQGGFDSTTLGHPFQIPA